MGRHVRTGSVDRNASLALPTEDELISHTDEPVESYLHELQTRLLVTVLRHHFAGRRDVLVASDLGFYYRPEQKDDISTVLSPDLMVVFGATYRPERMVWATWNEGGLVPSFVVELLSNSTQRNDRTHKLEVYERVLQVPELVHYHPMRPRSLALYRLDGGVYHKYTLPPLVPAAPVGGRMELLECRTLGLSLGRWRGEWDGVEHEWVRFFLPDGVLAPLPEEAQARRADEEARRADEEARRADEEARRADALEAQVAALKAQLEGRS